eukprot:scaffold34290_cov174-Isochrysis_galbana.AAC.1
MGWLAGAGVFSGLFQQSKAWRRGIDFRTLALYCRVTLFWNWAEASAMERAGNMNGEWIGKLGVIHSKRRGSYSYDG